MANTLNQIQRLSGSLETKVDVGQINREIQRCMLTLENIQRKIFKYQQSLSTKEGSGNALRDAYKKLRFQNHKERVADYKRQISAHYRSFQVQLQISGIDVAVSDGAKVQARFNTTDSMLSQIVEAVTQKHTDKSIKGNPSASKSTANGVLIAGYVRPALQKVESITSGISKGAVRAKPIMAQFDLAATTCKQRCYELALECSRDNTLYRDTEFDIDVDLFQRNRDCLDNLRFGDRTFPELQLSPMSVHRVRDIFPHPKFYNKPSLGAEVGCNRLESSWWQAGIATAFNVPALIERLCVFQDERGRSFSKRLYPKLPGLELWKPWLQSFTLRG